jgi:hypothetical protein
MITLTIEETTAVNARRKGVTKEFKSLSAAKRLASSNQVFYGTVLNIFDASRTLLAYKSGKNWTVTPDGQMM